MGIIIDMASRLKNRPRTLPIVFGISLIVLIWVLSLYVLLKALWLGVPPKVLPSQGEMATLLFGASSLALFLFSFAFAGFSVIGWQSLRRTVYDELEAIMLKRAEVLEKEVRGRVLAGLGMIIGVLHSNPDQWEQADENKEYLPEAILYSREAYELFKDVEGNAKYMALNNLVYLSCLNDEDGNRAFLLNAARELYRVGLKLDSIDFLLTYCRVILQFEADVHEMREAFLISSDLRARKELTPRQKREAEFHATALHQKLRPK
jgi:hypothetical protein